MKKLLTIVFITLSVTTIAQDYTAGEKIFKGNCASCHKMDAKLIGPPLENVVADQGEEWTKKWIYNNQTLRDAGDAHAIAIFEEYNKMVMPSYSYLTDDELTNLTTFIGGWKEKQVELAQVSNDETQGASGTSIAAPTEPKELSAVSKVILSALAFAVIMITLTILTLYRAFITMVQVNKELHQKAMANNKT
jgi:mono/diheme cytochrome c family protein